ALFPALAPCGALALNVPKYTYVRNPPLSFVRKYTFRVWRAALIMSPAELTPGRRGCAGTLIARAASSMAELRTFNRPIDVLACVAHPWAGLRSNANRVS